VASVCSGTSGISWATDGYFGSVVNFISIL
jgi:hypothetical protein